MWQNPPALPLSLAFRAPGSSRMVARVAVAPWRPARSVVITTSLALSLLLLGGVTEADAGSGAAAIAPLGAHLRAASELGAPGRLTSFGFSVDDLCVSTSQPGGPMTQADLAQPFTLGLRTDDLASTCSLPEWYTPAPLGGAPTRSGQVILVSLRQQWLWAYQDGRLVYANPVATGRERLRTPAGTYQILSKAADILFHSPWPRTSPYYYTPEHINYALLFRAGGFYIHDAPWRDVFGPGSESLHFTTSGALEDGSHGCVNVTTRTAAWLYGWARVGAIVMIVDPL